MKYNLKIIRLNNINNDLLNFLESEKLLKSYAFALAGVVGFNTPTSYLILDPEEGARYVSNNKLIPFQIRVDYKKYTKCKPLGGVYVSNVKIINELFRNLIHMNYYPIITPDRERTLSRFRDIYSFNILSSDDECIVEVVGQGFDLSDLKRGDFVPREIITIKKSNNQIIKRELLDRKKYKEQIYSRKQKIYLLKLYEEYLNRYGIMIESLKNYECLFKYLNKNKVKTFIESISIQEKYSPLPDSLLKKILYLVNLIKGYEMLINKKYRKNLVYSLSYMKNNDILLWDIYGPWYHR